MKIKLWKLTIDINTIVSIFALSLVAYVLCQHYHDSDTFVKWIETFAKVLKSK